jgi:hypothetical protein
MSAVLTAVRLIDRVLRDAERGLADPDRLLAPLGELTSRLNGAGGEGPGGVPWYAADDWSWFIWGWRLRAVVRDWVAAGRVLDRRGLKKLKLQARPLFDAARQWAEVCV